MKAKKPKLFLGGFVNCTNAQNLNCLALAKYLNKDKYDIYTLSLKSGNLEIPNIKGVTIWSVGLPYRIFKYFAWLKAVIICDVLYLPKRTLEDYLYILKRLFNKKSFITIEGVCNGTNMDKLIATYKSTENFCYKTAYYDKIFSITKYMAKYNYDATGLVSCGVLYLGIDYNRFCNSDSKTKLTNIIFVGSNMRDKGINDYLNMAKLLPNIKFHIAGGGGNFDIKNALNDINLSNIIYHGSLSHDKLSEVLKGVQLMFFPSRSEGFPKVTLECAAAGVPSIVYGNYGAAEWITTGVNGFVVDTFDEAKDIIEKLQQGLINISEISDNARELAKRFDWQTLIKDWEHEIDKLIAER